MRMMRKMIGSTLGLLALVGMVAACGGATGEVGAAAAPATVTVVAPAAPAPASTEDASAMPNLIGRRLDVAEAKLDALGIGYVEVGGGTFGIVVRSNWTVCETDPSAGAAVTGAVSLIVDRECG
jgi:PASTA domain